MPEQSLHRTALYDLHAEQGARFVPFAGYEMPVQYRLGVLKEHQHTRVAAGLFDVSHMGQLKLMGAGAASALESLVPVDVVDLAEGHQRYAMFTNEQGGILDDLMITNAGDHLFVVVNAACKDQDLMHLQHHIGQQCEIVPLTDHALLALQGPAAASVLEKLVALADEPIDFKSWIFMKGRTLSIGGVECFVTRSGYTGEDGFEISVHASQAETLARALLAQPEVKPIGLGARNSLRLEAGLCLYGNDIDTTTTPVEANLNWAMQKVRRTGGARAGGFPGAEKILAQLADATALTRKRVGLKALERIPVRDHTALQSLDGAPIGEVTSGLLGPTINVPVAMGYVKPEFAALGTKVNAIVRGKAVAMEVVALPFVPANYFRG